MNKKLMLGTAIAAFVASAAIAQTPSTPSTPGTPTTPNTAPNTAPAPAPSQPVAPNTAPRGDSNRSLTDSMTTTSPTVNAAGETTADKIQGLKVYTLRQDAPATPPAAASATMTVTRDEISKMRSNYQSIGEIEDLVLSLDGRVTDAVVSVGGFLGVGERHVAVKWGDIKFVRTSEGDAFAFVSHAKADLEKMPEYKSASK